jgi:hypothetical protein
VKILGNLSEMGEPGSIADFVTGYFEQIEEKIKNPSAVNEFLIQMEKFEISLLENVDRGIHQKLLFVLLKMISGSDVNFSVIATERLLLFMKKIPSIFESFSPNEG